MTKLLGRLTMLRYTVILMILLPAHAFAGTTESTLPYILDVYQAECVASQKESMELCQRVKTSVQLE